MNAEIRAAIARMKAVPDVGPEWAARVVDVLEAGFGTDTPFGTVARLHTTPGPFAALIVAAGGKVDQSTMPASASGIRYVKVAKIRAGEGTRIGYPVLKGQKRGDTLYLVLTLNMRPEPVPVGGPGGEEPNPGEPPPNDPAP